MKIELKRKSFLNALNIGAGLAGRSKALPVLDNVKIRVKNSVLTIVSMDSESAISKRMDGNITGDDGEFLVNAQDIIKAIKALKDDVISLEYSSESNSLAINHSTGNMFLSAVSASEFPHITLGNNNESFQLSCEKLFEWLNASKNFVANDTLRPAINGLYIESREYGNITVCATDRLKLYTDGIVANESNAITETILMPNVFSVIQSLIDRHEFCTITIDELYTSITVDGAKLCIRKIDGSYPNFRVIIPRDNNEVVRVNKTDFIDSLVRASLCANSFSLIRMTINNNILRLESDNAEIGKKAKESLACQSSNVNITIGFKYDTMLNILSNVVSETVTLHLQAPNRAILIKDEDVPDKTMLLMPCLID